MATIVGIRPRSIYLFVFAVGSAFSGVGGIILAIRGAVLPDSGLDPTFTALVVVFLAGLRSSALRFGVFGVLIGLIQSFASVYISAAWASVVVFGCLFVFVALTPFLPSRGSGRRLFARAPAAG
jgi:branched-chain amino acid transport system permease protein